MFASNNLSTRIPKMETTKNVCYYDQMLNFVKLGDCVGYNTGYMRLGHPKQALRNQLGYLI